MPRIRYVAGQPCTWSEYVMRGMSNAAYHSTERFLHSGWSVSQSVFANDWAFRPNF